MATPRDLKRQMASTRKLGQVTQAMEAVAAARMRSTQEAALSLRPYVRAAVRIVEGLYEEAVMQSSAFGAPKGGGQLGVVLISADRGLAGAYHANLLREVEQALRCRNVSWREAVWFVVGRRGAEYVRRRGGEVVGVWEGWGSGVREEELRTLATTLLERWHFGVLQEVIVGYSHFHSPLVQEARTVPLLPITLEALHHFLPHHEALPRRTRRHAPYLFHPSPQALLDAAVPLLVRAVLAHAAAESVASEQAARRVAMKQATDRSGELLLSLTRSYHKARQASITREVAEIVGGIEAMS